MADRRYPTEDFDEQARLPSVARARLGGTDDIRNAMLEFRRVFEDLMTTDGSTNDRP